MPAPNLRQKCINLQQKCINLQQKCIKLVPNLQQKCIKLASNMHQKCIKPASNMQQKCIKLGCCCFCCFASVVALQGMYDYGTPDYMPILPSGMSGVCLAAIINLAMCVLTFLQPTSPAKPIAQHTKGEALRQTLNNARGYFFPYGDLKHLAALDDPDSQPISASEMARIINAAISAAGFMGKCWTDVRAAGALPTGVGMPG
jgi:hypothetical protein